MKMKMKTLGSYPKVYVDLFLFLGDTAVFTTIVDTTEPVHDQTVDAFVCWTPRRDFVSPKATR